LRRGCATLKDVYIILFPLVVHGRFLTPCLANEPLGLYSLDPNHGANFFLEGCPSRGHPPSNAAGHIWNGHSYHGSGAISSTRNQCDGTAPLQEAQWTVLLEFVDIILGRMPSSSGVHPAVVDTQVSMVLENRLHSFRSMMVYQGCVLGYRVLGNS